MALLLLYVFFFLSEKQLRAFLWALLLSKPKFCFSSLHGSLSVLSLSLYLAQFFHDTVGTHAL